MREVVVAWNLIGLCFTLGASCSHEGHHPCAEQFDAGAAMLRRFERLQSIDLAFRLAIAPRLHHSVSNRADIVSYRYGKSLHGTDAALSSVGQPDVQLLGNFPDRPAGVVERSDLIEKSLTIGAQASPRPLSLLRTFRSPSLARVAVYRRTRVIIRSRGGPFSNRRPEPTQLPLDRFPEILKQVETVSNLPGLWRALTHADGIKARAVTADNLNLWMPLEPIGGRNRRAIRQQFHHLRPLRVDDQRPVVHSFFPCPIINAGHADRRRTAMAPGALLYVPENRSVADRHAEAGHQPFRWAPTRAVIEKPDDSGHANGSAGVWRCEFRETIGEDPSFTMIVLAAPSGQPRAGS